MAELTLTDSNFDSEVVKSSLPVLVDFWAPWCAPCKLMGPIIEEIAKEMEGKLKVGKYNVDESGETAQQLGILSIPTFGVWKDGKVTELWAGAMEKDVLVENIKKAIA